MSKKIRIVNIDKDNKRIIKETNKSAKKIKFDLHFSSEEFETLFKDRK